MRASVLALSLVLASRALADCGNRIVEAGEACDDGVLNGSVNSCCDSDCTLSFFKKPDVVVGDIPAVDGYGSLGGINAYSIATDACNVGTCWLNWDGDTAEHPVIGQNMYRLKDGRFEQIGQSWLKHGFAAAASSLCGECENPLTFTRLGVNCSDLYDAGTNGTQTFMGPKEDVNPLTGVFPYPDSRMGLQGNVIYKRLQVHTTDLDPTVNPGAHYFVEAQYVARDDAEANNLGNNASYRAAIIDDFLFLTLTDTTQRKPAIQAWKVADPAVRETTIKNGGTLFVSAKATPLGGGFYRYEYAIQNLTFHRAGQSFTVPIPPGATIANVGFHDVDYHSGEPFSGTDWTPTVTFTSVSWATQTYDVNPNANALRWGTLYNFRFDANIAPGLAAVTIGVFRPGSPTSVSTIQVAPGPCGALPGDAESVALSQSEGVSTISWTAGPGSSTSSVLRGLVSQLPVGPGGGDEVCLENDIPGSATTDSEDPGPGEAFWYVVRSANACGDGSYGNESLHGAPGAPRLSTTCP
jgi:hypothetical protein